MSKVFVSCAVTGSGDTASKHPDLPKTPEQIAKASIEAAKAGAAIAHIHVREEDGKPIMIKKIGSWVGSLKNYFNEVQKDITDVKDSFEEDILDEKDNKKNE